MCAIRLYLSLVLGTSVTFEAHIEGKMQLRLDSCNYHKDASIQYLSFVISNLRGWYVYQDGASSTDCFVHTISGGAICPTKRLFSKRKTSDVMGILPDLLLGSFTLADIGMPLAASSSLEFQD